MVQLPNEDQHIFTEGIDYRETGDESIWGPGDPDTLAFLNKQALEGKWLSLAAGDGRYNTLLLQKADEVLATDIDESALEKLVRNTPPDLASRLTTQRLNLTQPLPFRDVFFDGVFCTGTLHLYPTELLRKITKEIDRVLKPGGTIIIDFATDVERRLPDGTLKQKENEVVYRLEEAEALLRSFFSGYTLRFIRSSVPPETVVIGKITYTFRCNFFIMKGKK